MESTGRLDWLKVGAAPAFEHTVDQQPTVDVEALGLEPVEPENPPVDLVDLGVIEIHKPEDKANI